MKKTTATSPLLWLGLLAVGPATILFVYFAHAQNWVVVSKAPNEVYALCILPLALLVFLARARHEHNVLYGLLAGFALAAWLREWHFAWTHHGIYLMLALLIFLGWWWRERLLVQIRDGNLLAWLSNTMLVYFLGVLVARRVFRELLPNEEAINTPLEEFMENMAHSLLLLTALLATPWMRPADGSAQGQAERDAPTAER